MSNEAADVLEKLLSAKWRDIEFPVTRMRMSIAHDLVEHKFWGVDGARVEDTGLAPIRFTFSAPLFRGIAPGRAERWDELYPTQFRALAVAFTKKSTGVLQHPEFGEFTCKAERMDVDWEATQRGGCDAELSFVETKISNDEERLFGSRSPAATFETCAKTLDNAALKADLRTLLLAKGLELPPYLADGPALSLGDLANKVRAIKDYPDLLARRGAGQLDALVWHAQRIGVSAQRARSATTWQVTQQVERLKAAAHDEKRNLLAGQRDVAYFVVPHDTTLAGVVRQIPEGTVSDLVRLNPDLLSRPEIPRGTRVRYYASRRGAA